MKPRVLFHVQHLLGIGHLRRAAILTRAMGAAGLEVTVMSGGMPNSELDHRGAALVQLPPARALDAGFKTLVDEDGLPLDGAFHARRTAMALDTLARVDPHLVLIETYPFGRRAFRPELDALIAAARDRRPRPAILASIRDILVSKNNPKRNAEIVARVRRDFDAVLVHGDPALVPLAASFPAAAEIEDRLRYTGYVTEAASGIAGTDGEGEVVVSVGGGAVGGALLRAALAARPQTALAEAPWRLVAGPNLPEAEFAALAAERPLGVSLDRYRPDLPCLLRRCRLSVSQGGYNTLLDLLQAEVPALVIPFAQGEETEQSLRARLLAERGYLHVAEEAGLDQPFAGAGLAAAITATLRAPRPRRTGHALLLDGARRSAEILREFRREAP